MQIALYIERILRIVKMLTSKSSLKVTNISARFLLLERQPMEFYIPSSEQGIQREFTSSNLMHSKE